MNPMAGKQAQQAEQFAGLTVETRETQQDDLAYLCGQIAGASLIASHAEFEATYDVGEEIGRGAFSVVHAVTLRADAERRPVWERDSYAVKVMSKDDLDEHQLRRMRDECRVLSELKHPHVIELVELYESPREVLLLMERADGGELFDAIVKAGSFDEPRAAHVMRQLLHVLAFMHRRGVIHRDVMPENRTATATTTTAAAAAPPPSHDAAMRRVRS